MTHPAPRTAHHYISRTGLLAAALVSAPALANWTLTDNNVSAVSTPVYASGVKFQAQVVQVKGFKFIRFVGYSGTCDDPTYRNESVYHVDGTAINVLEMCNDDRNFVSFPSSKAAQDHVIHRFRTGHSVNYGGVSFDATGFTHAFSAVAVPL